MGPFKVIRIFFLFLISGSLCRNYQIHGLYCMEQHTSTPLSISGLPYEPDILLLFYNHLLYGLHAQFLA